MLNKLSDFILFSPRNAVFLGLGALVVALILASIGLIRDRAQAGEGSIRSIALIYIILGIMVTVAFLFGGSLLLPLLWQ